MPPEKGQEQNAGKVLRKERNISNRIPRSPIKPKFYMLSCSIRIVVRCLSSLYQYRGVIWCFVKRGPR